MEGGMQPDQAMADTLRDLETTMRDVVAEAGGVAPERVEVKLAIEPRDGKDGMRVDVLIDGKVSEEAEKFVAGLIGVADRVAFKVLAGASGRAGA